MSAGTCGGGSAVRAGAPRPPRAVRSQADLPGRPSDGPRDPCAWEGPARPDDDREKDLGCSLRGRTRPSFSLSSSDVAMISTKALSSANDAAQFKSSRSKFLSESDDHYPNITSF